MSIIRLRQAISPRLIFSLLLLAAPMMAWSQESATETPPTEADSSSEPLRAYLELQGQIHSAQQRTEQTIRESIEAAGAQADERNAKLLAGQLRDLEQRLTQQRSQEARFHLYVFCGFAGLSFLAIITTAYFQWRAVSRIADFTASLPEKLRIAASTAPTTVALRNSLLNAGQIEDANSRLLGTVERLEKRILELENAAVPPLPAGSKNDAMSAPLPHETETSGTGSIDAGGNGGNAVSNGTEGALSIQELLDRGQTLLNEDRAEEALAAFDEVLKLAPQHADALVKKGAAFEKLRKLNEAIECYDRAIAADSSMTIAYLHKGGLFNRLERFTEAMECYEKALRTQEKQHAA